MPDGINRNKKENRNIKANEITAIKTKENCIKEKYNKKQKQNLLQQVAAAEPANGADHAELYVGHKNDK